MKLPQMGFNTTALYTSHVYSIYMYYCIACGQIKSKASGHIRHRAKLCKLHAIQRNTFFTESKVGRRWLYTCNKKLRHMLLLVHSLDRP